MTQENPSNNKDGKQKSNAALNYIKKRWFVLGMIPAISLAALFPKMGISLNPGKITTTSMVIALFFLAGLSLPTESIKAGMKNVRLHVFIQVFIFIICPLFFMLTAFPFKEAMDGKLIVGIYALACLPTTVSSCIVFTQISEGNVIGTVFNASLSNLAGIFLSPLLLTLLMESAGEPMPMEELLRVFVNLVFKMLIPFAAGQGLHILFKKFATRNKSVFGIISNAFVLSIVFFGVSGSAGNASFQTYGKQLIVPFIYLAVSHLVLLYLVYLGTRLLRLDKANTISALYAAPQKTLAMGLPLLSTYFVDRPEMLGVAILPILFYHPWQLFIAGLLKNSKYFQLENR
ncbi:MAG: bile acid:sodium symporter [bacterium]|nr:bile acid:sodium symporter [bacterium]